MSTDLIVRPLPYAWIPSVVKNDLDGAEYSSLPPLGEPMEAMTLSASTEDGCTERDLMPPDGEGVWESTCLQYDCEEPGLSYDFFANTAWDLARREERVLMGVFRWESKGKVMTTEGRVGVYREQDGDKVIWQAEMENTDLNAPCTIMLSVPSELARLSWTPAHLYNNDPPAQLPPSYQNGSGEGIVRFHADLPLNGAIQPKEIVIMSGHLEKREDGVVNRVPAEIRVEMRSRGRAGAGIKESQGVFPFPLPDVISTNLRAKPTWSETEVEVLLTRRNQETEWPT
ncbi:hypothetical protein VKT23_017716 [Stygiomarasmius scandens]|uniref:CS domain-containing protein n=1 Tax=Marasmiellus scandens TaxID=2682957 RepID=A0ABR1ISP2_9AGAR